MDATRSDSCWEIYPFILIGLHTAMRRSEILTIRWEHVDLERRVIHIPRAKAGARDQPTNGGIGDVPGRTAER